MPNVRQTVTVDGLAASGKTALARQLAGRLGFVHLNTGLLYRGTGWLAVTAGISPDDETGIARMLADHSFELVVGDDGASAIRIDDVARGPELQSTVIADAASRVGKLAAVRAALLPAQRNAFPGRGLVAEGRDMGTVVFPDAPVKFFVEARVDVRAGRRIKQLSLPDDDATRQRLMDELAERDRRDMDREIAPMKVTPDAILIDNSDLPLDQVVERMVSEAARRLEVASK